MRGERDVEERVEGAPGHRDRHARELVVEERPLRVAAFEARVDGDPSQLDVLVLHLRPPHHREEVRLVDRRVRVDRRVAVRVVHPVQNRVRPRVQVARTLDQPRHEVKRPLGALAHRELTMRTVPVQKEGLEEDRRLPVEDEQGEKEERCHPFDLRRIGPGGRHVSVIPVRHCHGSVRGRPPPLPPRLCHDASYTLAFALQPGRRAPREDARSASQWAECVNVGTKPRACLCSPPAPGSKTSSPFSTQCRMPS